MSTISAKWTWTEVDLEAGRKLFAKANGSHRFWAYVLIGFLVTYISLRLLTGRGLTPSTFTVGLLAIAAAIAILIVKTLISPILRKREFKRRPDANQEIHWLISNQTITIITADTKAEVQWSSFYKVFYSPVGLLFLPNEQIFYFIPKRAFLENDFEKIRSLAFENAKVYSELK